jgi:hypothetical protein
MGFYNVFCPECLVFTPQMPLAADIKLFLKIFHYSHALVFKELVSWPGLLHEIFLSSPFDKARSHVLYIAVVILMFGIAQSV